MPEKPIEVILFDLGNTLIYFDGDRQEVNATANKILVETLFDLEYQLDPQSFSAAFSNNVQEYFDKREKTLVESTICKVLDDLLRGYGYENVPAPHLLQALRKMYSISESHWQLENDAIPMLEVLKKKGFHLGLISNAGDAQNVYHLLEKGGLYSFFEIVVISAETGIRKPHPTIFKKALNYFKTVPEHCIMVGDTLDADILGASVLGIGTIWINRRVALPINADKLKSTMPDVTVNNLSELPDLIDHWGVPDR